jgi:hypothetical protein
MQKLLSMVFLPSFCPVSGLVYSQVQWRVPMTCLAASVWQPRQALVTSDPLLKGPCSSLNLLWSAVDFDPGLTTAHSPWPPAAGAGAANGLASATPPISVRTQPATAPRRP